MLRKMKNIKLLKDMANLLQKSKDYKLSVQQQKFHSYNVCNE